MLIRSSGLVGCTLVGCTLVGLVDTGCGQAPAAQNTVEVAAALAGKDGPFSISSLNQFVNTYADLSVNAAHGASSITVTNASSLGVLSPGDLLLIIQMQGAAIDTIDSNGYGLVTAQNGAGLYELIGFTSRSGNSLNLDATCGGLRNDYSVAGHTQVLRVAQYTDLTIPNGTSVTAPAWNGTTGGVVAIFAQGGVTFGGGSIDVSGKGFRGGAAHVNSRAVDNTIVGLYRSIDGNDGGEKGEGIAGYETDLASGRYGRGAPANGGGGGNYARSGGGGGANGNDTATWTGQGVMDGNAFGSVAWALDPAYQSNGNQLTTSSGGGRGGYSLAANDQDAHTVGPGDNRWGPNQRQQVGGFGGYPVKNNPASRLFVGGGGGAGDKVTSGGTGSNGGSGGGLVLLFARDISGGGTIVADGAVGGASDAQNDGAGGGGSGGTILISASHALAGPTLSASGGLGGPSSSSGTSSEGPGGGGGGGYVALFGGTPPVATVGGNGGTSSAATVVEFPYNGATGGAAGQPSESANLPAGVLYPSCVAGDLKVTVVPGPSPIAPGGTDFFTVTVENQGPNPLTYTRLVESSPFGAAQTFTCTATGGATCAQATGSGALGGSGGTVDLPSGGKLTYVVTGKVPTNQTGGMITYTLSAVPPNGYGDPTPQDDSATANIAVLSGNIVDLAIVVASSPTEPAVGEPVHYDFTVTNQGPGSTQMQTVSFILPSGARVESVQLGDGWNCSTTSQMVTCTRNAALAAGQSTELQLVIDPPAGASDLQITAQVAASDGADANALDNRISWDVALGKSMVYAAGGGLGCELLPRPQAQAAPAPGAPILGFVAGLGLAIYCTRRRRFSRSAVSV